jgi:hypothetical protein
MGTVPIFAVPTKMGTVPIFTPFLQIRIRSFAAIDMRHKVLVGIIMTGILLFLSFEKTGAMEKHGGEAAASESDAQDMAINKQTHYAHPWKVHEIAEDFDLLDVWEIPILADETKGQDFFSFLEAVETAPSDSFIKRISTGLIFSGFLVMLRQYISDLFSLDKDINVLPIPGCKETSVKDRLIKEELERSLDKQKTEEAKNKRRFDFVEVYTFDNETLRELSNNTAHVLMHLGWVHKYGNYYTAQLAVYAKPRNSVGRLYLMLIMPFRRLVVYPTMVNGFKSIWEAYCSRIQREKDEKGLD